MTPADLEKLSPAARVAARLAVPEKGSAEAARAYLHAWAERPDTSAEALVLVAAVLRFGPPGRAVATNPSPVSREPGDEEGTTSLRPEQGPRERAHSACDHAFREVARWLGVKVPASGGIERSEKGAKAK